MSTKCTIGYGDDWHLFNECFENDNVHLILENMEFSVDKSTNKSSVRVQIPIETWRSIIEQWDKSYWAEHQELDNKPIEFCLPHDAIEIVVETPKKTKIGKITKSVSTPPTILDDDE